MPIPPTLSLSTCLQLTNYHERKQNRQLYCLFGTFFRNIDRPNSQKIANSTDFSYCSIHFFPKVSNGLLPSSLLSTKFNHENIPFKDFRIFSPKRKHDSLHSTKKSRAFQLSFLPN